MKRIFLPLLSTVLLVVVSLTFILSVASCGPSKEATIPVTAFQWTVRLQNCSSATGIGATESEAKNAIKDFSELFSSKVKTSKISKVLIRVPKPRV